MPSLQARNITDGIVWELRKLKEIWNNCPDEGTPHCNCKREAKEIGEMITRLVELAGIQEHKAARPLHAYDIQQNSMYCLDAPQCDEEELVCETCGHQKGFHFSVDGQGCSDVASYDTETNSYERCHCQGFIKK